MIRSALGNSSCRKSISPAATRPARPASSMWRSAIGCTTGRSQEREERCGWRAGDDRRQLAGRAADVGERPVRREIELVGKGLEIGARDAGHRRHELLEPRRIGIELVEHRLAALLDLVLRLAGAERRGEIGPEGIEAAVRHFEQAADVARAGAIEIESGGGRVHVARARAVAAPGEQAERDQSVEEVKGRARMKAERLLQLRRRLRAGCKLGEQAELDRAQQGLRRPETHADLEDRGGRGIGFENRAGLGEGKAHSSSPGRVRRRP